MKLYKYKVPSVTCNEISVPCNIVYNIFLSFVYSKLMRVFLLNLQLHL
jgi:hypothetical protein